jgi:Cellulose biosynthesis protein BcsS
MVSARRVRAAVSAAAALAFCCVCVSAVPAYAGGDGGDDPHAMLFSGRDIWFNGAFLNGGMLWSPSSLEEDGLLLKVLFSGGLYRYDAGDLGGERVIGEEFLVQVLPGWHVKRGSFEAKVFWGPEYQHHHLSPDDPSNRLRGGKLGLRFSAELWDEPTATTMIAADASLSTVGGSNSARAAFGWKMLDQFYAGPETQVYGGDGYAQWRLGAHVTSMKTGDVEWSAAGGWARDSNNRSSPYLRLGFMQRM